MDSWKMYAMALVTALAAAGMVVACDEGTDCESDEDCEEGEVCDTEQLVCEVPCESDADCDAAAGEVCVDEGSNKTCGAPGGEGGSGGSGGTGGTGATGGSGGTGGDGGCTSHADCYPVGFCGEESGVQQCYTLGTECARAQSAPAADPAAGPILFFAEQQVIGTGGDNCRKEPAACQNNGNVCQFTVGYYDPQGDVATSKGSVYSHLFFIRDNGSRTGTFDADAISSEGSITFRLCYDEATASLGGAVQLDDDGGHKSNATCLEGSAP